MRLSMTVLFLLCVGLNSQAWGTETGAIEHSGQSSFTYYPASENSPAHVVKKEVNFIDVHFPNKVLLKVESIEGSSVGREGVNAETTITAYNNFKTRAWTLKDRGAAVKLIGINQDLISLTESKCCGDHDVVRFYRLDSGEKIEATYDSTTTEISVPNTHLSPRYLASVKDSTAPSELETMRYIGTLSYFSKNKIIDRARVYAQLPPEWGADFEDLTLTATHQFTYKAPTYFDIGSMELWGHDGETEYQKAYDQLQISGKIYFDNSIATFSIPINGDRMMAKSATVTGPIKVVPVDL